MDHIDRHIVMTLQRDARTPYAELARQVGLTAPAVTDRIHKLETAGVVRGYHAEIDLETAGRTISALIGITVSTNSGMATELISFAQTSPDVLELHRTAGSEDFTARVAVESVAKLEQLVNELAPFGRTTTSIILSSPVSWREVTL